MTTAIRANVIKCQSDWCDGNWFIDVEARRDDGYLVTTKTAHTMSWPEAMQAAYKIRADLERELMDEVHASRARRREDMHAMEATA